MQHNPSLYGVPRRPSDTPPPAESVQGIPTTPFSLSGDADGYAEPEYREYVSLTVLGGPGYRQAASGTSTIPVTQSPYAGPVPAPPTSMPPATAVPAGQDFAQNRRSCTQDAEQGLGKRKEPQTD